MRYLPLCFLTALALGGPVAADPSPGSPAAGEHQAPASYVFVPGDVIDITVSSHQGYDRTITIPPDGRIQFPSVGEFKAAGLTMAQLAARLQEGLNAELVDPKVAVSLKELNKQAVRRVSVLGAVKTPGVFELKEHSTPAELLAAAGGPTPVADLRRITVTRADAGKQVIVDLSGAARTGNGSNNLVMEPGDLIRVPEGAAPAVMVLGEVVKPGSYELQGEMRLLNALSLAGGPTPKADLHRVTLTRAGQATQQTVDLQELLTNGGPDNPSANVQLQPGDAVILPESERKYYVLGEVNKPEAYPLKPNDHLLDAITTAGGSSHEAELSQVMLIRKDDKGQPVAHAIDLNRMMKQGNMAGNDALQQGDIVFVPSRRQKRPLADLLGLLSPLSTLLYVLH
jgi:protein involved in polysaccharide export with SLBB domain